MVSSIYLYGKYVSVDIQIIYLHLPIFKTSNVVVQELGFLTQISVINSNGVNETVLTESAV